MKSIVTGGCGFIGSHLVNKLVELEHDVIVLDKIYPQRPNANATYHCVDLSEDYNQFSYLFDGVKNVFHLASEVSIPYCVEYPNESMKNNVLSTMNVLECSRIFNVDKFVFSSTSAVYGNTEDVPSSETTPISCLNTYSISKYSGEQLCKMYCDLYGLKTTIFRYFNVYGEGQHKTGQYAPVMSIFKKQKDDGKPLTIVEPGYQTRDFIHVSDVVAANIIASQKELNKYGEVFNIGTGKGVEIQKIADLISNIQTKIPKRPGEVLNSVANNDKVTTELNWNFSVDVLEWVKNSL